MANDDAEGYPSLVYSNYTLALLWGVYFSNQWARYILNYLYAISSSSDKYSIAEACDLSTSEYGLLTGYGFSATFVITGLFMGRLADSYNRRNIIVAGCLIWNLALAGMGMSSKFWELLMFRLILGFGEAFSNPASYSSIADLFPPEKRPTANGTFATAVYVGGGMASLSMVIAEKIGWRAMFFLCAIIGGCIAILMFMTCTEPTRHGAKKAELDKLGKSEDEVKEAAPSVYATLCFLMTDPHTVLLLAAASIRFCGGYAIAGYLPTFYEDRFSNYTTEYSYINAYVVAFGGFMSSYLGGKVSTMWIESGKEQDLSKRWPGCDRANYYVPTIGCLGGIPFFMICICVNNFYVSLLLGLFGEYLIAECWFGPYMSALQGGVPSNMRGLAVAVMMLTANFFGSLTAYIMGVVQDKYDDGAHSLKWILMVSVVGTYACAAILFLWASVTPLSKLASDGSAPGSDANKSKPTETTSLLQNDEEELAA
jgi:MFS family permease